MRLSEHIFKFEFGQPEISQLYVSGSVEQQVFGLQVPVDYVELMQVLYTQDHLRQPKPSRLLLKVHLFLQQFPQITSRHILKHEHVAAFLVEGKMSLCQEVPRNLFVDFVLLADQLELLLSDRLRQRHYL